LDICLAVDEDLVRAQKSSRLSIAQSACLLTSSTLDIENKNKGGGSWGCSQLGSILISSIFAFIPAAGVFIFSMNAMMMMMMNVSYLDSSQRNIHTFSVDGTLMNEFINISPKLSVIVYVSMINPFFMTFWG
jgi:hypothetical protein